MRRALLIANPIAGSARAGRFMDDLARGLSEQGVWATPVVTTQRGDAREQAAAQAAEHDLVVVVGGDGTINEVVNGLDADRPIGIYPLGTGNVLAKELRVPRRLGAFCRMIAAGRQKAIDVASAGERRFVSMAGAGFDAAVAARVAAARRGGIRITKYILPLVRCLATYRFPRLAVRIDGAEAVESSGFVLVSNVRAYGGPLVITPEAKHDDGVLDVCVMPRGSRLRYGRALFAFFVGWQRRLSGAHYFRGRRVEVRSDERVHYQVDGDPVGFLPATFELGDRKQRVVVP